MKRKTPPPAGHLVLAALVSLTWLSSSAAQEQPPPEPSGGEREEVPTLVLDGTARAQVRLAFPQAEYNDSVSGDYLHGAREIEQTLRDDLEDTGIFNIQGPTELSVLMLTGSREHDFEQYRSLGNEVVFYANIKREGEKLVLEGRLYDLPSRQSITGKRYRGLPPQARRIAHTMADELHYQFTGRPGIALTSIAFHSDRDVPFKELYLMDYDGSNQRKISAHKSDSGFCDWSPSGDAIAYMSYWSGTPGIYFVDLETSRKIPVYRAGTLNLSPSFSPDGQKIAFAHSRESNVDVYVCERVCNEPRRLTRSRAIDTNPVWSPSGTQLAFTSDRSGRPNIYVMESDGSDVRRISFEGEYNDGVTWRPDGTHIAYASRRGGRRFQIAVTGLIDLATRTLTSGPDSYEEPSFSPDGRRLAFTRKRGKGSQIFVMDADGENWRQLTHEGNNMGPDWSSFPPK